MVLTLSEVAELKKEIANHFSTQVHFHDRCGGQSFSLDETNNEIQQFIMAYFADLNMRAVFSEDSLQFTVK